MKREEANHLPYLFKSSGHLGPVYREAAFCIRTERARRRPRKGDLMMTPVAQLRVQHYSVRVRVRVRLLLTVRGGHSLIPECLCHV